MSWVDFNLMGIFLPSIIGIVCMIVFMVIPFVTKGRLMFCGLSFITLVVCGVSVIFTDTNGGWIKFIKFVLIVMIALGCYGLWDFCFDPLDTGYDELGSDEKVVFRVVFSVTSVITVFLMVCNMAINKINFDLEYIKLPTVVENTKSVYKLEGENHTKLEITDQNISVQKLESLPANFKTYLLDKEQIISVKTVSNNPEKYGVDLKITYRENYNQSNNSNDKDYRVNSDKTVKTKTFTVRLKDNAQAKEVIKRLGIE